MRHSSPTGPQLYKVKISSEKAPQVPPAPNGKLLNGLTAAPSDLWVLALIWTESHHNLR